MSEMIRNVSINASWTAFSPKALLRKLFSLGIGVGVMIWLASQVDVSEAIIMFKNVPLSSLLFGFLVYALSFYLRATRFSWLLPSTMSAKRLFPIVLAHYTALNIIPARLGELSYVYLLKKIHRIAAGQSISSLLMARVFDHMAISLLFLISSACVTLPSQWLKHVNAAVAVFLFAMFIALAAMLTYTHLLANVITRLLVTYHVDRSPLVRKAIVVMDDVVQAMSAMQGKKLLANVFGISVCIWLCIFSVNYLLLNAFDVNLSYVEVALASTCIIMLSVLPFQGTSGLGVHETTWTFIAVSLGVPKQTAIVAAFSTHALSIVYLCLFGAYGLWACKHTLPEPPEAPEDAS